MNCSVPRFASGLEGLWKISDGSCNHWNPGVTEAIMLPLPCFTDVAGFRAYFRKWDKTPIKILIPGR